jgi:hypothetical protein
VNADECGGETGRVEIEKRLLLQDAPQASNLFWLAKRCGFERPGSHVDLTCVFPSIADVN